MIVLLDNQDSFVYNLVDGRAEYESVVFRNTVDTDSILELDPSLFVLSPGPGCPVDAGCMPSIIHEAKGKVPMLGICLGYQGLVEHFSGTVQPCGPVHGVSDTMTLTSEGLACGLFDGMTIGLQFHPESILTPAGPTMLRRCVDKLKKGN